MASRRARFVLVSTAAAAAAAFVLWRTSDLGRASADLPAQMEAARREGVPLEWKDVERMTPPVPAERNAAVPYRIAFASYEAAPRGLRALDRKAMDALLDGALPEAKRAEVRKGLHDLEFPLNEVRLGASRAVCSFDRDWSEGFSLAFPEYGPAHSLARALCARALLSERPAGAVADLRAAARLGEHIGSEPTIIGALLHAGIESTVLRSIQALGRRGGAWNDAVRPVLEGLAPVPSLRQTLAGEAVAEGHLTEEIRKFGLSGFAAMSPADEGNTSTGAPAALRLVYFGPASDGFKSRIVRYWRRVYARLPQDPLDVAASRRALADEPADVGLSYALLDFARPVVGEMANVAAKMETNRRLTRAALDLWSGRSPALPQDPFGPGPLRLKRSAGEWTLYSVGPNGRDEGGRPQSSATGGDDLAVSSAAAAKEG